MVNMLMKQQIKSIQKVKKNVNMAAVCFQIVIFYQNIVCKQTFVNKENHHMCNQYTSKTPAEAAISKNTIGLRHNSVGNGLLLMQFGMPGPTGKRQISQK